MYDKTQLELMKEEIIVIDQDDNPIKPGTKKECHLLNNNSSLLHRAFSVFLFDPQGEKLLMQKRSTKKITFPLYWANTCCSHPFYTAEEMELGNNNVGVKRAAIRKLKQELGITSDELPIDQFKFITKIHYSAAYDDIWGEHEIDHILIIQAKVNLNINYNEVEQIQWLTKEEVKSFVETTTDLVSPWFKLIENNFLYSWWDNLQNLTSDNLIHRLN